MSKKVSIFWFRRDLRLEDNHALYQALSAGYPVLVIFIFDKSILKKLPKNDHRVSFIHKRLTFLNNELSKKYSTRLQTFYGKVDEVFRELSKKYDIQSVYCNRDYEPYAKQRDAEIEKILKEYDIKFLNYKDQVIFEKNDVLKDDGSPYVIYTAYMRKWKLKFSVDQDLQKYDSLKFNYIEQEFVEIISLSDIGFEESSVPLPIMDVEKNILDVYGETRDFPAIKNGTSHAGLYLRFGIISIRTLMKKAISAETHTYMNELIWREFFMQILWHFPYSAIRSFREKYDFIQWRNNLEEFEKWKNGMTGYPIVDAGMRELNQTGYMHNRVRMITASFLCKHLLIDWRWGERYFAEKLFDYEMSSNVGNWQWVAGSGVDAVPYFRIFNPEIQMKKFDPQCEYIRRWVPEYFGVGYVSPIVNHQTARDRAIKTYKIGLDFFEK